MKKDILPDIFLIANTTDFASNKNIFLSIFEWDICCQVISGKWNFKCLRINTTYNSAESGVLRKISWLFSDNNISIFAFTSIDYGYFFFEEKFQKQVETDILKII